MWPFKKKQRAAVSAGAADYYDHWIRQIVVQQGDDLKSLLEHVKHHADEGLENGVDWSWVASMLNLVDIIARHQREPAPSLLQRLDRLYRHWAEDPVRMTPPPAYMPEEVRDFLKLGLAPKGTVLEAREEATGPRESYPKDHPGLVHHSEAAEKDVWCPIVGRSS